MIVVFDADIFESKVWDYGEVIALGEQNSILAVSNPAFELFLLLHCENAYEQDILPNADAIIKNEKVGNQTFIYIIVAWKNRYKFKEKSSNRRHRQARLLNYFFTVPNVCGTCRMARCVI